MRQCKEGENVGREKTFGDSLGFSEDPGRGECLGCKRENGEELKWLCSHTTTHYSWRGMTEAITNYVVNLISCEKNAQR